MQLVEKHIITKNKTFFKECDTLCFKSKNLYNSCLYVIKQRYDADGASLIYKLHDMMKDTEQYKELPAKVSSTVLLMVQKNYKSFFKANAEFNKNPKKFKGKPKPPKYLDKIKGRFITSYTNQAISKKVFSKTNKILLSKTNIEFKTKIKSFKDIDCVRIVPNLGYYTIEVVYTIPNKKLLINNGRYTSIDLGVNNLATLTSNVKEITPIIINGKPLKSINQFYNKELSKHISILDKRKQGKASNNTKKLNLKRKNKVENYLHRASKTIISHCLSNEINTIIIGKNDGWKQDVDMNKTNNQNFVNIPHSRFIDMIKYKCEIEGIQVKLQEESYTSKASFLNLDNIPVYGDNQSKHFGGYRKCRGLYKIRGEKRYINADVNGSYNILRKAIPNVFENGIEGIGVYPKVITLK